MNVVASAANVARVNGAKAAAARAGPRSPSERRDRRRHRRGRGRPARSWTPCRAAKRRKPARRHGERTGRRRNRRGGGVVATATRPVPAKGGASRVRRRGGQHHRASPAWCRWPPAAMPNWPPPTTWTPHRSTPMATRTGEAAERNGEGRRRNRGRGRDRAPWRGRRRRWRQALLEATGDVAADLTRCRGQPDGGRTGRTRSTPSHRSPEPVVAAEPGGRSRALAGFRSSHRPVAPAAGTRPRASPGPGTRGPAPWPLARWRRCRRPAAYQLPISELQAVAEQHGLQWVNSDAEKIRRRADRHRERAKPAHVPREIKPVVLLDEGPLVLVETRKDLVSGSPAGPRRTDRLTRSAGPARFGARRCRRLLPGSASEGPLQRVPTKAAPRCETLPRAAAPWASRSGTRSTAVCRAAASDGTCAVL